MGEVSIISHCYWDYSFFNQNCLNDSTAFWLSRTLEVPRQALESLSGGVPRQALESRSGGVP
jgi:hypothetical protein